MNTAEKDPAVFQQQAETVCAVYAAAPMGYQAEEHTASTDEVTSIQALERTYLTQPMQPGQVE